MGSLASLALSPNLSPQALAQFSDERPRPAQDNINAALRMGASNGVGHGLEGLKFDIPRSITLEPTRTLWDMLLLLRNPLDSEH